MEAFAESRVTDARFVFYYRRPLHALAALQEDWLEDRPKQHAETSGFVLSQMALRPSYAAFTILPAVVRFIEERGPCGVDGVLLTALSAAQVRNPHGFWSAIDDVSFAVDRVDLSVAKPEFVIPFFDLGPLVPRPEELATDRAERMEELLGPIGSKIFEALSGGPLSGSPEQLFARYGRAAGIIAQVVASGHGDEQRQLISGLRDLARGSQSQMLPGFGPAFRSASSPLDEFRKPSASYVSSWGTVWKVATALVVGAVGVAIAGPTAAAGAAAYTAVLVGSAVVGLIDIIEESWKEANEEATPPPSAGNTSDPDDEEKVSMPVPDDVGNGGAPTFWEILEAAARYAKRLDPLIYPMAEDMGGVTILQVPQTGDIDPPPWVLGGTVSEEDLIRWLAFLQAKYWDSLVNPLPYRETDAPLNPPW